MVTKHTSHAMALPAEDDREKSRCLPLSKNIQDHQDPEKVGAWDIPPAWWDQFAPAGRLVVPLRWRGQTQSIAFTHADNLLLSDSVHLCGFVPMLGQEGERSGHIDPNGQVTLYWDEDQPDS
jgi:hypothetical protein